MNLESALKGLGVLVAIQGIKLEATELSTGEVSEWMSGEKKPNDYRPLSHDRRGLFAFGAHGVDDLLSWSGSSSSDRSFAVDIANDGFMFFREHRSHYEIAAGTARYSITPGTGVMTSADRYAGLNISAGSVAEGFSISRRTINAAFVTAFERSAPSDFEFAPSVDLTKGPAVHLLQLMTFFRDGICADKNLEASPIALASFRETICLLMLENLPHNLSGIGRQAQLIAPRQVRRALDFAMAYNGMPITVADMAEAAGVSVRSLQLNFQRFLGDTPLGYLRKLRLEAARKDILAADASETVSQIARRWGFVNLGRFSHEYRAAFGVLPSRDLARIP